METTLILVTDWEEVEKNDFYLTKEWERNIGKENLRQAKNLQKKNSLFYGYVVDAVDYAVFKQMDAHQVFIDDQANIIIECERAVISNDHEDRFRLSNY